MLEYKSIVFLYGISLSSTLNKLKTSCSEVKQIKGVYQ